MNETYLHKSQHKMTGVMALCMAYLFQIPKETEFYYYHSSYWEMSKALCQMSEFDLNLVFKKTIVE